MCYLAAQNPLYILWYKQYIIHELILISYYKKHIYIGIIKEKVEFEKNKNFKIYFLTTIIANYYD